MGFIKPAWLAAEQADFKDLQSRLSARLEDMDRALEGVSQKRLNLQSRPDQLDISMSDGREIMPIFTIRQTSPHNFDVWICTERSLRPGVTDWEASRPDFGGSAEEVSTRINKLLMNGYDYFSPDEKEAIEAPQSQSVGIDEVDRQLQQWLKSQEL